MADLRGNGVVGRQRLASDLRRHRQMAQRTIEDVAAHLECSPAKVSRMETGVVGVRIQDLRAILEYYEVPSQERELLLARCRQARERGWWQAYTDVVPADSARFYGMEDGAETVTVHTTSLVPGLFQTHEYMIALVGAAPTASPEVVGRRIELRRRRQQLLDRADPPRFELLLDEAVLCRPVGGPAVFAAQLDHLREMGRRANVSLRIVPFDIGVHSAVGVSYTIFEFDGAGADATVFVEQLSRGVYIDDPREIELYRGSAADVRSAALSEQESSDALAKYVAVHLDAAASNSAAG